LRGGGGGCGSEAIWCACACACAGVSRVVWREEEAGDDGGEHVNNGCDVRVTWDT
jgi:hypothetical protein